MWNIGYRRIGDPGGGWPDTLLDVAAAVDHLATLVAAGVALDLGRVTVAGHSAGGHLALWVAAAPGRSALRPTARVHPHSAVGFAAVSDLARAGRLGLGRGAVDALLQGSAADQPGRVDAGSPRALLPLGVPQLLVHGDADDVVPLELSRDHAHAARASGDEVELVEIEGGGHMDCLDPASGAHAALCAWLARR